MSCARWLSRVFTAERSAAASELPLYLCPSFRFLSRERAALSGPCRPPGGRLARSRQLHTETNVSSLHPAKPPHPVLKTPSHALNLQCHGCGALSQTVAAGEPGYYDLSRKVVKQYLGLDTEEGEEATRSGIPNADEIVQQALKAIDVDALDRQGIDLKGLLPERVPKIAPAANEPPLCDRCHNLAHHSTGNSIYHPSIESLHDTIEESPYKVNHVYHVIDAADFPMSLIPRLHSLLDVSLRSQNRRSKAVKYQHGRLTEMSFIITRSDLLAPKKEQVDALMPYLTETLRGALGRIGGRIRLGNVHCVSARNGWWTRDLKETIWERGGAGWFVGKANVGKSRLFQSVFPQGRMDEEPSKHKISVNVFPRTSTKQQAKGNSALLPGHTTDLSSPSSPPNDDKPTFLTPLRPETNYPAMPLVSSLPGTTAFPIRVPYGSGRGELIDLPGLARSDLELHVREDRRADLLMKSRVVPVQQVIKPGQSLVLGGGLIRLTPRNTGDTPEEEELVFLAYAFTPIEPHLTATHKAVALQEGKSRDSGAPEVESIVAPGAAGKMAHAGAFQVRYDVTKKRTGPLTTKVGVGLKVEQLPYRVLGIDILIEGCGWVEVAVQVRTKQLFPEQRDPFAVIGNQVQELDLRPEPVNAPKEGKNKSGAPEEVQPRWPVIDVYSPEGKFVGYRPPMSAWVLNKPRKVDKMRPRRSMKGVKKMEKRERRGKS